jgi:hypothetical protein
MIGVTKRVRGQLPAPVFHRKGWWLLILLLTLAVVVVWQWASTITVLSISQAPNGRTLYQAPIDEGNRFSLTYVHSIHRTPVEEFFVVSEKRQIVLDATSFESYGVGMPTSLEGDENLTMVDGTMRIEHINRTMDSFELRIGQVIADHKLRLRGQEIPLSSLSKPGSAVRFQISRLHIWDYVKGGLGLDR